VSVSADTALVGAPFDDTGGGADAGSAHAFVRSCVVWIPQQQLLAADGAPNDRYGTAVSVSVDSAIVGAPLDDTTGGVDAGSAYIHVRSGTVWAPPQKLMAPDEQGGDQLGASVALAGDAAFAGAPFDDNVNTDTGSAQAFVRQGTTWSARQKVLLQAPADSSYFGYSVALAGDWLAVGAVGSYTTVGDAGAGSVFIFERTGSTWTERQMLIAADGEMGASFGRSVALSGDTLVIGATGDDSYTGSAYVFVRAGGTFTLQQKLLASDRAVEDLFGESVSVSGDTVAVGALKGDSPVGADLGTVYVFVRSGTTWSQEQELYAADGAVNDLFGFRVTLSGDTLVTGAYADDTAGGADAGSASVFVRTGTVWSLQQQLFAPDALPGDLFGSSVSLEGDTAIVGAMVGDRPGFADSGAAYVFVRAGSVWTHQQKLFASDATPIDFFGRSVSLSGERAAVGAELFNAVYLFQRSGTTWTEQQKLTPPAGGSPIGWSVSASGDAVVAGAPNADTPLGPLAGEAYVFREQLQADLSVSKTDGVGTATPGNTVTYTITVANAGPSPVVGATVSDSFPGTVNCSTTCAGSGGGTCAAGPYAGNIAEAVNLPVSGSVVYTSICTISPAATGTLENTAAVAVPATMGDPNTANNTATDTDTLTPQADLSISKSDGLSTVAPGQAVTYTIVASNAGPSDALGATVADTVPAALTGATWTCSGSGGGTCTAAGAGDINDSVDLPGGGSVTYLVSAVIDPSATGTVSNTATVAAPGGLTDPVPGNNSATDTDPLIACGSEIVAVPDGRISASTLATGAAAWVAASVRIGNSYSVEFKNTTGQVPPGVLTIFSGDDACGAGASSLVTAETSTIDPGASPAAARQSFTASGTLTNYRARLVNGTGGTLSYTFSWSDTTMFSPAWSDNGTFDTFYSFQNTTGATLHGTLTLLSPSGTLVISHDVTVAPGQTVSTNTLTLGIARNQTGTARFTHDGPPGAIIAETAIANFSISPAYVQPVKFEAAREAR
jgi:uncharacterized repeat protein (TIGR01451 family)